MEKVIKALCAAALVAISLSACQNQTEGEPSETRQIKPAKIETFEAPTVGPDGREMNERLACLARTIYFEARGDGEAAMRAVAHVVMNRRDDPFYPDTVCGVAKQGGEKPPCQFSWWCDGKSDTAQELEAWRDAVMIARQVLAGESNDPTDGANMFHHVRINPYWADVAEPTHVIGNHQFYRLEQ